MELSDHDDQQDSKCYFQCWISRIFLKPNQFWFQKNDRKKVDCRLTSEGNGRKNAQNDKTIINTIYMKPDFPKITKIAIKKIVM